MSGSKSMIVLTDSEAAMVWDMLSLKEGDEVQKSESSNKHTGSHLLPTRMRRTLMMCRAYEEAVLRICRGSLSVTVVGAEVGECGGAGSEVGEVVRERCHGDAGSGKVESVADTEGWREGTGTRRSRLAWQASSSRRIWRSCEDHIEVDPAETRTG